MTHVITLIKEVFYAFMFGAIGSLVVGIAATLAVASFIQTPLYTLLVVGFFIPFNFSDLKKTYLEHQWLTLAVRIIAILGISAFIFGLIRFSSGYGHFAPYMMWVLMVLVPILFILVTTYWLCIALLPKDSDLHLKITRMVEYFRIALKLRF